MHAVLVNFLRTHLVYGYSVKVICLLHNFYWEFIFLTYKPLFVTVYKTGRILNASIQFVNST